MNRIYMKQNGGEPISMNNNLRLNSALFGNFTSNNNLIINEIKLNKEKDKFTTIKMKTDIDEPKKMDKTTGETSSHSDTSSASAITPISPQTKKYLHKINNKNNNKLPLPPIPLLMNNQSHGHTSSSASTNSSLQTPINNTHTHSRSSNNNSTDSM